MPIIAIIAITTVTTIQVITITTFKHNEAHNGQTLLSMGLDTYPRPSQGWNHHHQRLLYLRVLLPPSLPLKPQK